MRRTTHDTRRGALRRQWAGATVIVASCVAMTACTANVDSDTPSAAASSEQPAATPATDAAITPTVSPPPETAAPAEPTLVEDAGPTTAGDLDPEVQAGLDMVAETAEEIRSIFEGYETSEQRQNAHDDYDRITQAMNDAAEARDCVESERLRVERAVAIWAVADPRAEVGDEAQALYDDLKDATDHLPQPVPGARIELLFEIDEFENRIRPFMRGIDDDSRDAFAICPPQR